MKMNDLASVITSLNNHDLSYTVLYLSDLFAKGFIGATGKEVWDKIKSRIVNTVQKNAIENFENNPDQPKNQAKLELIFETWLHEDSLFKNEIIDLLTNSNNQGQNVTIENGKNLVINSTIKNDNGSLHIGDSK